MPSLSQGEPSETNVESSTLSDYCSYQGLRTKNHVMKPYSSPLFDLNETLVDLSGSQEAILRTCKRLAEQTGWIVLDCSR